MPKTWLLTWTTYGTWLPGSKRGFVGKVIDGEGRERLRNQYGTPVEAPNAALERHARRIMLGEPVYLTAQQAECIGRQLQETATYRRWGLHATAVMWNHVHVVLTAPDDVEPETLLRDLKSYASRALNRLRGAALMHSWWTESGSRRQRRDERAKRSAIRYVERQRGALYVYSLHSREAEGEKPAG